jgi:hypothetical protein
MGDLMDRNTYARALRVGPDLDRDELTTRAMKLAMMGYAKALEMLAELPPEWDGQIQFVVSVASGDEVGRLPGGELAKLEQRAGAR